MTSFGLGVVLAAIWVLLWGSASPANMLGGVLVAVTLIVGVPGVRRRPGRRLAVRPVAASRLLGYVVRTTIESNVVLTREVLARRSRIRTAIVGVPLPECSDELLTLITNLLALAPGTMPLELELDPNVLYVHVLHLDDVEHVRRDIQHLTTLAVMAFGSVEACAALDVQRMERR